MDRILIRLFFGDRMVKKNNNNIKKTFGLRESYLQILHAVSNHYGAKSRQYLIQQGSDTVEMGIVLLNYERVYIFLRCSSFMIIIKLRKNMKR